MKVAVLGLLLMLAISSPAGAADAVVMLSDAGDYIGGGEARVFHPGNAQITVGGSTSYLSIGASGGTYGDGYHFEFAAPAGQVLAPGVYDRAQRAPFREAGRPGIDIGGDGRGCNTIEGRFEVRDFTLRSDGTLERLWIVYEQHCEGGTAATYGEVRLGFGGALAPGILRWPLTDMGKGGGAAPVTYLPAEQSSVTGVSLAGDHPGDFSVRLDECSGKSVPAGGSCQVWVRFTPTTAGTRTAVLRVTDSGGRTHESALQGFAYGGSTRLVMNSDEGDYIGGGGTYSYTPDKDGIAVGGTRRSTGFSINGGNGDWWYGTFAAAEGDILAPGRYAPASRYPFNGTGAGLDISGNGAGCNTLTGEFTITEITFTEDGALRTFGADFEQHCEGAAPALRGTIEFRKGDQTTPPPWTVSGPGTTGSPTQIGPPGQPGTEGGGGLPGGAAAGPGGSQNPAGPCETRALAALPRVLGTSAADRLRGRARSEVLLGLSGNDRISAGPGADCLDGGEGDDGLSGAGAGDRLHGGLGDDSLRGGHGNDRLNGGAGADLLAGQAGRDRVAGGPGDDTLVGGSGTDSLRGGGGNDGLLGGPGRDVIDCGPGLDVAYIGRGDRVRACERRVRAR